MNILNNIKKELNYLINKNNWSNWIIELDNDTFKLINTKAHYQYAQWKISNYYNDLDFIKEEIEGLLYWMSNMNII